MVRFVGGVGWADLVRKWAEQMLSPAELFETPLPRIMVVLHAEPKGESVKTAEDWNRVRAKLIERRKAKKGY